MQVEIRRVVPYYGPDQALQFCRVIAQAGAKSYVLSTRNPLLASLCDRYERRGILPGPKAGQPVELTWNLDHEILAVEEVA